jgi:hypothetical protein
MSDQEIGSVLIGRATSEYVTLQMVSKPDGEGWYLTEVSVRCRVWTGRFRAQFKVGELSRFGQDIEEIYKSLSGSASLDPSEPYLRLTLTGDGKGHIAVNGAAQDELGQGTELVFSFELDQTELPSIAKSLRSLDT